MKTIFFLPMVLIGFLVLGQNADLGKANPSTYLSDLKKELQIAWPKNNTINMVFHGHSVPAGYFKTPQVNTLSAYPALALKKNKSALSICSCQCYSHCYWRRKFGFRSKSFR